jgi:hypothetical protein
LCMCIFQERQFRPVLCSIGPWHLEIMVCNVPYHPIVFEFERQLCLRLGSLEKNMPPTGWIALGCCCRPRVAQVEYFCCNTNLFFEYLTWPWFALMGFTCKKYLSVYSGHCFRPIFILLL